MPCPISTSCWCSSSHILTSLLLFLLSLTSSSSHSSPRYSATTPLPALTLVQEPQEPARHGPLSKRHTPFLPGDHWKGQLEFGATETNVSVMVNGTARMVCPIGHVQDSAISFVRRGDFHILSNGHTLFTRDKRFEIVHLAKTEDWILKLTRADFKDAGVYECQVSIKSGLFTLPFTLHVTTPKARIMGSSEFHLDRGSTISLTCMVSQATTETQYVIWYHGERMISYDKSHSRVAVVTTQSFDKRHTNSTLTIKNAEPGQSGNYTCQPSNAQGASIQVFVSEDRLSEPLLRPNAKEPPPPPSSKNLDHLLHQSGASSRAAPTNHIRGASSPKQYLLAVVVTIFLPMVVINFP